MTKTDYRARRFATAVLLSILCNLATTAFAQNPPAIESSDNGAQQIQTEFPMDGNKLIIFSDRQEALEDGRYRAAGNVAITFLDMTITCDEVEYSRKTLQISTKGETAFRQPRMSLTGSAVELDADAKTVTIHDASGYFYDTAGRSDREFFLTGGMSEKIKAEKLEIYWGAEKKDPR